MVEINDLKKEFTKYFSEQSEAIYFSPGRVNIIGEHIDYNGGHVMPMAITLGIYGALKYTSDPIIKVISVGMNDEKICTIDMNDYTKTNDYLDYIKGVLFTFNKNGHIKKYEKGFNIYLNSTLPVASGLSSSASMEVLFSHIINDYYKLNLSNLDLVNLSVESERKYINVNCGIMDQFAIGMSEYNKVIYLDCNTVEYKLVPFDLGDKTLIIVNTKKPRNLIESKYNERRSECESGQKVLDEAFHKGALCNYTIDDLDSIKDKITDVVYKRCRHAILEEDRVKRSIKAMEDKDYKLLGKLLQGSHESLQNDYESSGIELDTIVSTLNKNELVLGSRMTGAGFGGCAIALFDTLDKEKIDKVMAECKEVYHKVTGLSLEYYFAASSDKTRLIEN
ncbi:Galactokinase [Neocallimastix lanati (nom. inval.)]|jgi:galactokinase|uniref:Galactokinase n=1 Tax=Neocallimastix californiae TaxID=1754190 RepID=A0A1Y1Z3P3_9FUNG|nr:Galactokinase [Neocallimastix sp. JGI-2020a]ORY04888.1 Galactokinase [Neocallimastix californiae]|eukprot:ORY04888.1 Galactokinase [Neocallimastix californiae]